MGLTVGIVGGVTGRKYVLASESYWKKNIPVLVESLEGKIWNKAILDRVPSSLNICKRRNSLKGWDYVGTDIRIQNVKKLKCRNVINTQV